MRKENLDDVMSEFRQYLALGHVNMEKAAEIHKEIIKQTERLQELEQQNNRYREAIEQVLHLKQQKENNVFEYSYDEIEEREESLLMDVLEESS